MRVLTISHTSSISGAEHSLLDLLDGLDESFSLEVACPAGPLADEVHRRGIGWIPLPGTDASLRLHPVWTTRALIDLVRSGLRIRRAVRRRPVDVVHANSLRAGLVSVVAGTSAPRVVFVRDCLPDRPATRLAAAFAARGGARLLANSRYTADCFRRQLPRPRPVRVVYSPVDRTQFDPGRLSRREARDRLGLPADRFLAGVVGQITPWKGQDTAVRALADVVAAGGDAGLIIAGSPQFATRTTRFDNHAYLAHLHRLVDAHGLRDVVHFTGERDDVELVMRALDVLLLPSWQEPFGRVVVEALAMGTRVIATDTGGPREILTAPQDGRALRPRDPALWARAIIDEMQREPDPDDVRAARRARAVSRFSFERHIDAVTDTWRAAAASGRALSRVLFVNHTADFSGAEVAMIRLLRALRGSLHTAVACPPRGRLADALAAEGVEVLPIGGTSISFRLHPRTTASGLAGLVRSMAALRGHTRRWRPDVIHANGPRAGLVAVGATRRRRPALLVQVHDVLPAGHVAGLVRRVLARRADRVSCVSDAASTAFDAGLPAPTARTTHISIDLDRFRPEGHDRAATRRSLGVPEDAPLLGVVAQISPWKGQHIAIEALVGVRRRHPRAHLVIAGGIAFSGPSVRYDNEAYLRALHERIAELGLHDAVHLVGHRSDVAAVMASLDLVLLPSTNEPFGTAVAEAMATGTVPLVSEDGGPAEFVEDGRCGRVLPPGDPEAWARAAADLLDDPALRARMGERAITVAQQFTDEAYAEACVGLYREALAT